MYQNDHDLLVPSNYVRMMVVLDHSYQLVLYSAQNQTKISVQVILYMSFSATCSGPFGKQNLTMYHYLCCVCLHDSLAIILRRRLRQNYL